ncbi:uncharacterized protein PRCAT00004785001 [Priceomyces carsonii]|uniref:uncharacterized protein n=1 Tax=Priceomyces carsonii TaxID=28549 RepID=UPI002EDA0650|nr:unnamed protein product [Priceomyces carsonii]
MMKTGQAGSDNTSFVSNFWGHQSAGYSAIQSKTRDSLTILEELLEYYDSRISIEKEYSKKLEKLNKRLVLGSNETGSLKASLDKFSYENDQMVKYNHKFLNAVSQINYEKLLKFRDTYKKRSSKIDKHMSKIVSRLNSASNLLSNSKRKYQEDCAQIKSLRLIVQTTWGKELERNQSKLNKLEQAVSASEQNYKIDVDKYNELRDIYIRDWSISLKDFYKLEIEKINLCKINCFNFCNNVATLCVDNDHAADLARSSFAQIQPSSDLQSYGDTYGTGNKIYKELHFIDFMNGYEDVSDTPEYTIAEFENPAIEALLTRSYSTYSSATQEIDNRSNYSNSPTKNTPNRNILAKELPAVSLPPPSSPSKTSPARKPPTDSLAPESTGVAIGKSNSLYSSSPEDNQNDIFSLKENNMNAETHKFSNSNGSSNYSNPTAYSSSNYSSGSSGGERTWSSPRRSAHERKILQEKINMKSKELPVSPMNRDDKQFTERKKEIPIEKDFSMDYIARALDDLKSGGNGDINKYRKSVRIEKELHDDNHRSPFISKSDYVDDRNEVATRYESINLRTPTLTPSKVNMRSSASRARPKSMLDPVRVDDFNSINEDLLQTVIRKEKPRRKSLLMSPTKSYKNIHSILNQMSPISRKPYLIKATARYTYKAQHRGELSFKKGWNMYVIHKQEDNWFVCELAGNCSESVGMMGLVPGNYIIEGNDLF